MGFTLIIDWSNFFDFMFFLNDFDVMEWKMNEMFIASFTIKMKNERNGIRYLFGRSFSHC